MFFLYNIFIYFYVLGIRAASLVNEKGKLWVRGRKDILQKIEEALTGNHDKEKIAWFHCASLGEFEQGRPVIEAFREAMPDHRIFLTFFSPSGYEIRKNYPGADHVFYLPADSPGMAAKFVKVLSPDIVFFIKYEYWYNYLAVLKQRGIPTYMVSAIFRSSQPFFRWYGSWFRKQLNNLSWFFVQDEDSESLLRKIDIQQVSVSGDTRFDRVNAIAGQKKPVEGMDEFCKDSLVMLAGSTWPEDEKILLPFILETKTKFKFIIAPHEVHKARIDGLMSQVGSGGLRFSQASDKNIREARVLVIDSIGLLASLYRYAFVSFVGGGFGVGIHNILEPAAFGVPVIFGPNYERFREARELIREGGATSIKNEEDFRKVFGRMADVPGERDRASGICSAYVTSHKGATAHILKHLHG
ncbi:MAG TPA: glycosyltransferase N-terminal domain-containing protein [Bacteroidales bacterium]|nr:glycosyltransferase N-terminal domain-containing protein [Bacteroidales bacterium]